VAELTTDSTSAVGRIGVRKADAARPVPLGAREQLVTLSRDWAANRGYPKSRLVVALLRATQYARSRRSPVARPGYLLLAVVYRVVVELLLGIEIPSGTRIGPGLRIRHGVGIVVNPGTVLGSDVMLRQNVTLGNISATKPACPVIGDGVELGAGAVVIGGVRIGDGARLGPNVVVRTDVPDGWVVTPPEPQMRERFVR
jgi:putative colanic acid biosynthesis acetyltransferase WcaB